MALHRTILCTIMFFSSRLTAADTPFTWKSVNIQGMGYVTGLIAHPKPPYDIYIRTDVGGAYRLDRASGRWLPLMDRYSMADNGAFGVESIAVDPSDPNTVYAAVSISRVFTPTGGGYYDVAYYCEVLVSHSRGAFWEPTGLAASRVYVGANDGYRGTTGERLAVDPKRPGRVYLATRKDGLWVKDGASEWTKVAGGLPGSAASPGFTFVVFDPRQAATRRVYTGVTGSGVWMSDDGGETWSKTAAGDNPARAAVATDGTLFVTFGGDEGGRSGSVRRFKNGAWNDVTPFKKFDSFSGISCDPVDPLVVVTALNHDTNIFRSTDQGVNWQRAPVDSIGNQTPYYPPPTPGNYYAKAGGWGNAALTIDPASPKRVYQTNGYGVIRTDDITAASPAWVWTMDNLEELVVQNVKAPPLAGGADLLSAVADMIGFRHASRDEVPLATVGAFDWVAQGTSIAYCASKPEYAAYVGWDEAGSGAPPKTGFTSDNGKTWTPFQNVTPGSGGAIAMSSGDPMNMVWAPTHNAAPMYTTDGGQTWKKCMLGGAPLTPSWQVSNEWWAGQIVAADMIEPGRFYYYAQGVIYSSADGGATWTQRGSIVSGEPPVLYTINVDLVPNPVKAGDLWVALSPNGNQPKRFRLYHSSDGGGTFETVSSVDGCTQVAFGKGNSAETPFLYIHGRVGGAAADAIYKSEDMGATWTRLSDPAQQQFGAINTLEGDMRTRDLVYVGTGGRGILYGYGPGSGIRGPSISQGGIANAAGYQNSGVAPGEIVTLFGEGLGPAQLTRAALDETGFVGSSLAGTQVFFDGVPAPMVYAWGQQTSAIAPYSLTGRSSTTVQVAYNGALSTPMVVPVVPAIPAVFTSDSSGKGQAVVINYATGKLNGPANPVKKGEFIVFYVTGDGQTNPAGLDGSTPGAPLPRTALEASVTIGGITVPAAYAGAAPGFVAGLAQFNVRVPEGTPSGDAIPFTVTVGGVSSPAVTLAIQ